jgi:hypothetical protein
LAAKVSRGEIDDLLKRTHQAVGDAALVSVDQRVEVAVIVAEEEV